jgi:hypothetical protein
MGLPRYTFVKNAKPRCYPIPYQPQPFVVFVDCQDFCLSFCCWLNNSFLRERSLDPGVSRAFCNTTSSPIHDDVVDGVNIPSFRRRQRRIILFSIIDGIGTAH